MAKVKPETAPDPAAEAAPRFVVTVTAPAGPRRRAGFSFGTVPVHLSEAELDNDKIKALEADPFLVLRAYQPDQADEAE